MKGAVIIILLAIGAWYSAYYCKKQRKFYDMRSREVAGEVISWDKHIGSSGRFKETYYDIEVLAENGETYRISTTNPKAGKYKKKREIVLLVPCDPGGESGDTMESLIAKERSGTITDQEFEQLCALREIKEAKQEAAAELVETSRQLTIIKEDKKSGGEYWLSVGTGIFLTAFAVLWIVAEILSP
ncbi:MAG: hypothetical protein IJ071_10805 [Ruminococcus sp.]|nr:hypothetical protein [Ruminococcus sp.]